MGCCVADVLFQETTSNLGVLVCICVCAWCGHFSRQQLGVVVFLAGLELLSPLEEGPEGGIWLLVDDALIPVGPNLQTNQRHTDVESPIELNKQ